jgi:hypothetical protein
MVPVQYMNSTLYTCSIDYCTFAPQLEQTVLNGDGPGAACLPSPLSAVEKIIILKESMSEDFRPAEHGR